MWYSFGVSYRKADLATRQNFAMSDEEIVLNYLEIFPRHQCYGFIINTCNRLTFFLLGKHPERVERDFYARHAADPEEIGYRFIGKKALVHLMEVGAGMDSQILGDFEIIGQVRRAFELAKAHGCGVGPLEKLINHTVHASRRIKNETTLSSGTASVSYAAVKFLENHLAHFAHDPVLVLGMGEIGKRAVDNLVAARGPENIYVSNRNPEKSRAVAERLGVQILPWAAWKGQLANFCGVISAVSAAAPIITANDLGLAGPEVLLDLSMPPSIDPAVSRIPGTTVYNVDEISAHLQAQLSRRAAALPEARGIVREELEKFLEWEVAQEATPVIQRVHESLAQKWTEEAKDVEKIDRISQKIECRLFNEVRKDPSRVRDIERWLNTLES